MNLDDLDESAMGRWMASLERAAIAHGAPEPAAPMIAAAVAPVIAALPKGAARPAFGAEPADFLIAMRECRR